MRVLGLVASQRKGGNSEILVQAMLRSLPQNYEKEMIRLTDLNIQACKACYACLPAEKDCIIEDDFAFLLGKIKQADAVVLASPCYFLGPHTSIKILGDRMISVLANSQDFAGKKCVTAVVYGIPQWEGYAREAVNNFVRFLHLDLQGSMLVQAASPGEVIRPEVLAEAQELAARLLESPDNPAGTGSPLGCPECGSTLLQLTPAGTVRCVMCNTSGSLEQSSEGYSFYSVKREFGRFTASGMEEHTQRLQEEKKTFMAVRRELAERRKHYVSNEWWVSPER